MKMTEQQLREHIKDLIRATEPGGGGIEPTPIKRNIKKVSRSHRSLKGWYRLRLKVISEQNGLCEECGDKGKDVHHIIPLDVRPDLGLVRENLMLLCVKCHRNKHPELPDFLFNRE